MQVRHEHHLKSEGREWGQLTQAGGEQLLMWFVSKETAQPVLRHASFMVEKQQSFSGWSLFACFPAAEVDQQHMPCLCNLVIPHPWQPLVAATDEQIWELKIQSRLGKKFCSWPAGSSLSLAEIEGLEALANKNIRNLLCFLTHSLIHPSLSL